ncbi:hypothetical protein P7D63_20895 [Enterococcus raffinosus]|uniref:hypothetical protein n=1 Tax=Enterococcus raffinosus TaxID=71452 RepID=UPI00288CB737|nr:hypothetical protein [Enterococcus raffinosus]MDT2557143.1 hypothetical protein [Enterococcus raffinosus]MDT2580398.1 hypothetical protein [Enterococcus raffinosus]
MKVFEIKAEFDSDLKRIGRMKEMLEKLRSVDVFKGATVRDWGSCDQVYFKEDECNWLNEMWSEKINSLIDEIEVEEKMFVEKWSRIEA